MTMPSDDHVFSAGGARAQRIEVFTGAGRRREWAVEQKAAIVAESYRSGNVSEVARRHGLTPTQLFTWRRAARPRIGVARSEIPDFVPVVTEAPSGQGLDPCASDADPLIGFELEGAHVWICAGADPGMVASIIRALKATT